MSEDQPPLDVEVRDDVVVMTMRRETKRNAVNPQLTAALDAAMNAFEDDPAIRVGILTGGPTVFSAGTDLKEGSGGKTDRGGEYGVVRRRRVKPLIAAVEGMALGGGFELVLACDLVVAGRSAKFGLPEVRRGVIATCGALFRTQAAIPMNLAKELLLIGEPIGADDARGHGLVNRVVDDGAALETAIGLARAITKNSPTALRETMRVINQMNEAVEERGWPATEAAFGVVKRSDDFREGMRAFQERRAPDWPGS